MWCCVYNATLLAISALMMPDTQRPIGLGDAGQPMTSAIARSESAPAHERGFGLALLLLSALSVVTGVVITVVVDWRGGLAMFLVATMVLLLFLRWEIRRRVPGRRASPATQAQQDLVITETSPL